MSMSIRKNPPRQGTRTPATQPHPINHIDDSSDPPASGDAVPPSPIARQRRGEPRTSGLYQGQNSAPPGLQTHHTDPGISDEGGMIHPDRSSSRGGEGDEPLFRELLVPGRGPPDAYHTMRTGQLATPQEELVNEARKPVLMSRPALYEVGLTFIPDNRPEEPYPMDTDPIVPTPPDYHYQLTPPTNPLHLSSRFDPLELGPEANTNGINSIVQSTEHAYALMAMQAQARMHVPVRRRATIGSAYVDGEDMGYATYSDGRPQGHVRQQQTSPTSWQHTSGSSGGAWSAQQSPTIMHRGWQQASPRNQGQDQSGTQQQPAQATPPGMHQTQAGWAQMQEQSSNDRRSTPPSTSPAFWRPGTASGTGPSAQSATTHGNVRPREMSWSQGDPVRPSPSSAGGPQPRWAGPGPSPINTANPAAWAAPHSMGNALPSNGATWQPQGAPPRSAAPLQHQPHPSIDGPSDNGIRWSAPNSATEPSISRGWQGPSEGSTTMASSTGDSAGGIAGGTPGTRYTADESGRPTQVRTHGANHVRVGSNQMSSTTWTQVQRNPRAPWMQMSNPPGNLPLDGRIQTPGGTGAMGGHAASTARPPTATPQMTGQYAASTAPGYPPCANRPGSVQGQHRLGEYAPVASNEIPYGSQPDSMVAYRASGGPGGGMQPPSSVASGPPQGYTVPGGPSATGNAYPSMPPAAGATPYGISRPGMVSQQQQQQHHQQPPPNAHGNMYPNVYTLSQQQPPSQSQPAGINGPVYASYTGTGPPPPTLTYAVNPSAPMTRMATRMAPGPGGLQMNAYSAMGAPQPQPNQDPHGRMGPGGIGPGGMEGYRPQQQH